MSTPGRKKKIAILGGGPGGISTAYHLTSKPGWQDEYDVTVYQVGWRLGGKCASGRSQDPDCAERIQEHGIHLLLGFYENVFHMMDGVYQEYEKPKDSPFHSWWDAVKGLTQMTAMTFFQSKWSGLSVDWPIDPNDRPGRPPEESEIEMENVQYLRYLTTEMRNHFHREVRPEHVQTSWWIPSGVLVTKLLAFVLWLVHVILLLHPLRFKRVPVASEGIAALFRRFIELVAVHLLFVFGNWLLRRTKDTIADRLAVYDAVATLDVMAALVRGMIVDDVIGQGFEVINGYDFCEWLANNGCTHTDFPIVRSGYDALFSYYGGDVGLPLMAAGVGLHGMLRMWFTYRGAVMYRMQAGMGDTIFAPAYQVLKKRGVSFEFFNLVRNLGLSADKTKIETVDIDVQATVKPDLEAGYNPVFDFKGVQCWPAEPFFDQLEQGAELRARKINLESAWTDWEPVHRKTLVLGRDFDEVVLAIPVGAHPYVCKELMEARYQWRVMVEQTASVQTQAMQLWLHQDSKSLGYDAGFPAVPNFEAPCATSYLEPFDTYVDMSDLLVREGWTPEERVRQAAYFCCAIADDLNAPPAYTSHPEFPKQQLDRVKRGALAFLGNQTPWCTGQKDGIRAWWPAAVDEHGNFKWPLLVDRKNREGPARLDAQFLRVNIDPSERYVLSLPATVRYRMAPDDSGFSNLYLAGDWTRTIMNSGCVEAAIISGMIASFGISGYPDHFLGALGRRVALKKAAP